MRIKQSCISVRNVVCGSVFLYRWYNCSFYFRIPMVHLFIFRIKYSLQIKFRTIIRFLTDIGGGIQNGQDTGNPEAVSAQDEPG